MKFTRLDALLFPHGLKADTRVDIIFEMMSYSTPGLGLINIRVRFFFFRESIRNIHGSCGSLYGTGNWRRWSRRGCNRPTLKSKSGLEVYSPRATDRLCQVLIFFQHCLDFRRVRVKNWFISSFCFATIWPGRICKYGKGDVWSRTNLLAYLQYFPCDFFLSLSLLVNKLVQ